MKKLTGTVSVLLACLMLLFASGCGQAKVPVDLDLNALTGKIIASGAYTDSMSQAANVEAALSQYGIDSADVADSSVYFSSMATAEECAIFKAASKEAGDRILTACKNRQTSQNTSYQNYVPTEVPKIEAAIVTQAGDYIVYIVSNNQDTVKTILNENNFNVK